MPLTPKQKLGTQAEQAALQYLQQQGLRRVENNYRCKLGEIDLIMRDGKTLVFVEVRARRNNRFGLPIETVAASKQKKLIRTALYYLQQHKLDTPCRFDVIGIDHGSEPVQLQWIKNAFQAY